MGDFDFEYWCALAQRDPDGFFRARRQAIDEMIGGCPPEQQQRLRQMQCAIDCLRARAGCPVQAIGGLCAMMHERLVALDQHQQALRELAAGLRDALRSPSSVQGGALRR